MNRPELDTPPAPNRPARVGRRTARVASALAGLAGLFLADLARSSVRLAVDVFRPDPDFRPAILAVEAPGLGSAGLVALATLVTLTPGTVVLEIDEETSTLYTLTLYAHDPGRSRAKVRRFADRIRAIRGGDAAEPPRGRQP